MRLPEYRFEYLHDNQLADLIDDIIRLESPIHEEELYARVKEVFGIKMIAKNRNKIESALFYTRTLSVAPYILDSHFEGSDMWQHMKP